MKRFDSDRRAGRGLGGRQTDDGGRGNGLMGTSTRKTQRNTCAVPEPVNPESPILADACFVLIIVLAGDVIVA